VFFWNRTGIAHLLKTLWPWLRAAASIVLLIAFGKSVEIPGGFHFGIVWRGDAANIKVLPLR
jgi:hypothetical protein